MPEGVGGGRIQQGNPSDYGEDLRPFKEKGRGRGRGRRRDMGFSRESAGPCCGFGDVLVRSAGSSRAKTAL